jgi:hypothetical protein
VKTVPEEIDLPKVFIMYSMTPGENGGDEEDWVANST